MTSDAVIRSLRDNPGIIVDPAAIPPDDPATFRLFCLGETAGVRRFDHDDALVYLRRLAPDRFAHLVAFQALNRMSTITTGLMARYIERRHGRERSVCEMPALARFFTGSYGLPLYREQLQAIARDVAGFEPDDAATLASAFCRFDEGSMPVLAARFVEGASNLGVEPREAAGMTAFFMRNAPFMLPESQMSVFAAEGYRLAWLKAHYRTEFEAMRLDSRNVDGVPGGP